MDEKMLTTEDVEVGTTYPTLHFPVRLTMSSTNPDAKFEFTASVDEAGQIILTPAEKDVEFTGAHTEWESDDYIMPTEDVATVVDGVAVVEKTIELTANMAQENDNKQINANIDSIGQCVIYPEEKENTFISVSVNDSLNLATTADPVVVEEAESETTVEEEPIVPTEDDVTAEVIEEKIEPANVEEEPYDFDHVKHDLRIITDYFSEESGAVRCGFEIEQKYGVQILSRYYNTVETDFDGTWYTINFSGLKHSDLTEDADADKATLCLAVLNDIKEALQTIAEKLVKVEDYFEDLGITDTDVDSVFLRDIEHMIENPNGDVSVTELINRVKELVPEEIISEELSEDDKLRILTRFRQGDISIFYDEGLPVDGLERLFDADTETSEYYYDPASDAVIYFSKY